MIPNTRPIARDFITSVSEDSNINGSVYFHDPDENNEDNTAFWIHTSLWEYPVTVTRQPFAGSLTIMTCGVNLSYIRSTVA